MEQIIFDIQMLYFPVDLFGINILQHLLYFTKIVILLLSTVNAFGKFVWYLGRIYRKNF